MRLTGILLVALIATSWNSAARAQPVKCQDVWEDTLPCHLDTLSWVEVTIQSDIQAIKDSKAALERLIRLRVRNDISFLKQETKSSWDVTKEYFDQPNERKRRGIVRCYVWTVGDDYPVAFHTDCALSGFATYGLFDSFEHSALGYGSAEAVRGQIEGALRSNIQNIASNFFEARDGMLAE